MNDYNMAFKLMDGEDTERGYVPPRQKGAPNLEKRIAASPQQSKGYIKMSQMSDLQYDRMVGEGLM